MTGPEQKKKIEHETLQGVEFDLATAEQRVEAIDKAFDYRGDVTIHTADGRVLDGYIFDRRKEAREPYLRLMPRDTTDRIDIRYADITRLICTGKDTAAGKGWETWVAKYNEKKAKGEAADLHPDPLD